MGSQNVWLHFEKINFSYGHVHLSDWRLCAGRNGTYGAVDLTGLAKNSWNMNPAGLSNTMVCNVNGPDGYLTIRSKPSSNASSARKLKRLSIVVVDTGQQSGSWVKVTDAYRTHTTAGQPQTLKNLPVKGWAHSDYLCDFLD